MAKLTQTDLLDAFASMTVLELADFKTAFEDKFGVTAAAPVAAVAAAAEVEEQTEFTATLTEIGPNKIPVIKVVRELTGLGLKEAKDLVDGFPKPVKEGVTKEEAAKIKAALDRKSTRLNSSHANISYAVFCLKKN